MQMYGLLMDGELKVEMFYQRPHIMDEKNAEGLMNYMKRNNQYNVKEFEIVPVKAAFRLNNGIIEGEVVSKFYSVGWSRDEYLKIKTKDHGFVSVLTKNCEIKPILN